MTSKVYFQSGFWKKLNSNTTEGIRAMLNVSDALSNSHVITDATEELIKNDIFLMRIIRKENYHRCSEKYINKQLDSLESGKNSEDLCATYMLDKEPYECAHIEKEYGVVALSADSLPQKDYLFRGDGFSLDKNHKYSQRYMTFKEKLQLPCNSLIIIDPYLLFKVDENNLVTFPGISNNLESLLNAILPQALKVTFHITIISSLNQGTKDVKRAYEKIKKCFKRIRKNLKIEFGFFYIEKGFKRDIESFHSRHILANSFMVNSEDGLDLFNNEGKTTKNNPTISIVFPRLLGNNRQDMTKYENWIKSVKKHVEEATDCRYCGTKENRMFDLIQ